MRKRAVAAWKRLNSTVWGRLAIVLGIALLWASSAVIQYVLWAGATAYAGWGAAIITGLVVLLALIVGALAIGGIVRYVVKGAS